MNFLIKLIAVLVLAGVVNAVVIEPAICLMHDDAVAQQEENGECCGSCHPVHHQGLLPSHTPAVFAALHAVHFVGLAQMTLSDPPARSIFHPPLAF